VDVIPKTGSGPENVQDTPSRLTELENEIREGLATYQQVGEALDEIHAGKFYRPKYKNFKTYLLERWGISKAHAYRLIAAAKVAKMSPKGDVPKTEREANKRKERAKPTPIPESTPTLSIVEDLDVQSEFNAFTERVELWQADLSQEEFEELIEMVTNHLEKLECGMGVVV
jgi:hypothetical protein